MNTNRIVTIIIIITSILFRPDIDECLTGERVCLPGQRCENLEGSARCVDEDCELLGKVTAPDGTCLLPRTCPKGFYHDTHWNDCKGTRDGHVAFFPVMLFDIQFSFQSLYSRCVADVNECVTQYPACQPDEDCINTIGSFHCVRVKTVNCPEGLQRSSDGQSCEDINECVEGE